MVTLHEVTRIHAPIERCFDLSLSVEVHMLGNRHFGEQTVTLGGVTHGLMRLGDRVTWQARHLGVRQRLTSAITRYDRPHAFQDTMLAGAFTSMQHDHFFLQLSDGVTEMRDVFRFAAPLGILGRIAEELVLRGYMTNLLRERNEAVRQVAESDQWRMYLPDRENT